MQNTRTSSSTSTRASAAATVVKRKVDDRIKLLIDDVARNKHRGLFLVVGDRAKDQVVNLHSMVSHANHNAKVNVLWCMKDELDFGSTSRKRQEKRARQEVKGGLSTEVSKDAFQTFLAQTSIRFCKYEETHKILGQTFGMAILQDFEAITPNTLARTCETVKGGGVVVILFKGLHSLRQLCAIVMDVHSRYRTSRHTEVVPRFNERFLLSLIDCDVAMCVDDDLNVNAITTKMRDYGKKSHSKMKKIKEHNNREGVEVSLLLEEEENYEENEELYDHELVVQGLLRHEQELAALQEKLHVSHEVGPLAKLCKTIDQVKTVLSLMQAVMEKTLDCTCVVTAARGRGKSAALGMAAAGALVQGYSNIFVTAPSPENVQTLFEFALRALKEFGYVERVDFEALQGTSEEFSRCIIRINVFRGHRQSIQFISATDVNKFAQAELAIIDEAAALPLSLVKQMMGSYLVFLSSTISGYEGTGRSLSMKLIADMRKRSGEVHQGSTNSVTNSNTHTTTINNNNNNNNRKLREMTLSDPIRYGPHDPVERWLNKLLCLEATGDSIPLRSSPHPQSCELYYVNRDALFSYHPLAESLLQRIQSLLAAAHYKNQPNDLQLLSDAPGHHLFVLCAKDLTTISTHHTDNENNNDQNETENMIITPTTNIKEKQKGKEKEDEQIPDVYCVLHVCEEGGISAQTLRHQMSHGLRPSGDLIPYTLAQYFLEESFAKLYGMRIIRIATNPEIQHAGYGSRALQLLAEYYDGKVTLNRQTLPSEKEKEVSVEEKIQEQKHQGTKKIHKNNGSASEKECTLQSRSSDPSLLIPITERSFEVIDYLGVSFGVTVELFNFWKRAHYDMVYLRQGANELTGEHSCVMVHPLGFSLQPLQVEFKKRFLHLLKMPFRHLPTELALSIVLDNSLYDPRKLAEAVSVVNLHDNEEEDGVGETKTGKEVRVFNIPQADAEIISSVFSPNDLRRLQLFASSFVEGGNILDLVPSLAHLYFSHQLIKLANGQDGVILSHAQAATVMAIGLQCINLEELSQQNAFSGVAVQQLRAFYHKAVVRLVEHVMKVMQLGSQNANQKTNKNTLTNNNDDNDNNDKTQTEVERKSDKADHNEHNNKDEDAREIYDASGKLIGLSVAKRVHKKVNVDSTLLRDASNVVVSDAARSNDRDVHKSLQDVFYRPKKGTRRH